MFRLNPNTHATDNSDSECDNPFGYKPPKKTPAHYPSDEEEDIPVNSSNGKAKPASGAVQRSSTNSNKRKHSSLQDGTPVCTYTSNLLFE